MSNIALLLVDYQNDYFSSYQGAQWALQDTESAAKHGAELLTLFREKQLPVVHIRHEFTSQEAPFFKPGSDGAQIHKSVAPTDDETVILKHHISSFRETNLEAVLKAKGVEQLIIVGAMSHMCIDAATRAATDLGFECTVAHDACTTLDLEFEGTTVPASQVHAAFMAALRFGYCDVTTTGDVLERLA